MRINAELGTSTKTCAKIRYLFTEGTIVVDGMTALSLAPQPVRYPQQYLKHLILVTYGSPFVSPARLMNPDRHR